jgi:hypothetical protein
MILFLDFDGVLHPQPNDGAQFSNAPRVWELLARHPRSALFSALDGGSSTQWTLCAASRPRRVASTWLTGLSTQRRCCAMTPRLGPRTGLRAWLAANRHSGPWLALDDMPSLFEPDSAHLYPVNAKRGLMHYDVGGSAPSS